MQLRILSLCVLLICIGFGHQGSICRAGTGQPETRQRSGRMTCERIFPEQSNWFAKNATKRRWSGLYGFTNMLLNMTRR